MIATGGTMRPHQGSLRWQSELTQKAHQVKVIICAKFVAGCTTLKAAVCRLRLLFLTCLTK